MATSVVGSSVKIVFCEGVANGLDTTLLNYRIIPPGEQALIKPVGGKHTMRAFIEGYLANFEKDTPNYLGFRDRDFDIPPPDQPQLIRLIGDKEIWTTYRACIESYFVDALLLHEYWSNSSQGPNWKYDLPPEIEIFEEFITNAASKLAEYQAVRWSLANLKPGRRWPEIKTTWTKRGSGQLPTYMDYQNCFKEASKLVNIFLEEVSSITIQKLEEEAKKYLEFFYNEDFYTQRKYLIWFQGKDLLAQVSNEIQGYLLKNNLPSNFPIKSYTQWAAKNLNIDMYTDLQELVEKITN